MTELAKNDKKFEKNDKSNCFERMGQLAFHYAKTFVTVTKRIKGNQKDEEEIN